MSCEYTYIVRNSSDKTNDTVLKTDKHFLNATEIAISMDLYYAANNITANPYVNYALGFHPHSRLAGIIASKILPEYPKYYYKRINGHDMRVYSPEDIYAIIQHIFYSYSVLENTPEYVSFLVADTKCMTSRNSYLGKFMNGEVPCLLKEQKSK